MSLIADALQKAESPRAATPSTGSPTPSPRNSRLVLGLCLVAVLTGWVWLGRSDAPSSGKVLPPTAGPNPAFQEAQAPLFPGQFAVSGIVTGSGKPLAIINNQLVEEGESIRGMKVVSVGADQVLLEKDQKITAIKLRK